MDFLDKINDLVQSGLMPNPITLIAQLLATFIIFLAFKHWVWKPMNELISKRQSVIIDELESARQAKEEAASLRNEYEVNLEEAKIEANKIIDTAKSQALETKEQMIDEAEKEAAYKLEKAEKEIALERKKMQEELRAHLVDIAFSAAEKLVNENIDDDKNRKLIDQFIEEVGE